MAEFIHRDKVFEVELIHRTGHCSTCERRLAYNENVWDHVESQEHYEESLRLPFMRSMLELRKCLLCSSNLFLNPVMQHTLGARHQINLRDEHDVFEAERILRLRYDQDQYLEESDDVDPAHSESWIQQGRCTICNAVCPSQAQINSHLTGVRHNTLWRSHVRESRMKPIASPVTVARSGYMAAEPFNASQNMSQQPPFANNTVIQKDVDVNNCYTGNKCEICDVRISIGRKTFITAAERESHENGAKHRMRVKLAKLQWKGEETVRQLADQASNAGIKITFLCNGVPLNNHQCVLDSDQTSQFIIRIEVGSRPVILLGAFAAPSLPFRTAQFPKFPRQTLRTNCHNSLLLTITPDSNEAGKHNCMIAVLFAGSIAVVNSVDFLVRTPGSVEAMELLKPVAKYEPRAGVATSAVQFARILCGDPPNSVNKAKGMYIHRLGHFDLPDSLLHRVEHAPKEIPKMLEEPLTAANHRERFQNLLWLEEVQLRIDIQKYDMESTFVFTRGQSLLSLQVPGLAEARPSVLVGDRILVSDFPFDASSRSRDGFMGSVHRVDLSHVYLKFHPDFMKTFVSGKRYYIRFEFGRIPLRRCHQAIQHISKDQQIVNRFFPSVSHAHAAVSARTVATVGEYPWMNKWTITTTTDSAECDAWIKEHVSYKNVTAIGLDTESWADYQGGPQKLCLIQIATMSHCLCFWLLDKHDERALPPLLENLIINEHIIKYVVDTSDDSQLDEQFDVYLRNGVDIQASSMKLIESNFRKAPKYSLEKIVNIFLPEIPYRKDKVMQRSNMSWPLTKSARDYAASDAILALLAGLKIDHLSMSSSRAAELYAAYQQRSSQPVYISPPTQSAPLQVQPYNSSLNQEQMSAVSAIVAGSHFPAPYVLFGPAGTGKTSTLIEAMQQLIRPKSGAGKPTRILACAPSNSAADLLAERMSKFCDRTQMFRLNALSRSSNSIPEVLRTFSNIDDDGSVSFHDRPRLLQFKLVIATCITAATLWSIGCGPGDFTHILIDESGHATEPEALAACTGLLSDATRTYVVLAGDSMQLGPIIHSKFAAAQEKRGNKLASDLPPKHSLAMSLLERLCVASKHDQTSPYHAINNIDNRYLTMLLHNYRSHPAILEVPNKMFYEGKLLVSAEKMARESLQRWDQFKQPAFPLIFHHVAGEESREGTSPSWYNATEAIQVVSYVEKLLNYRAGGLSLNDIGVISPYKQQVSKIRQLLKATLASKHMASEIAQLKIGSCEEFQGQERKAIIISTVRSQSINLQFDATFNLGFVNHPKRLNVAITRAKAALIFVGNGDVLRTDDRWKQVIDHCVRNGSVIGAVRPWMTGGSDVSTSGDVNSEIMGLLQQIHDHRTGATCQSENLDDDEEPQVNEEAEFVRNE